MSQLQDYVNDVQEMLHDTTASSWPLNRVISRINEARLDTARDCHCIRYNTIGVQMIPGVEIYNLQGAVAGAVVTAGGSNYGTGATVPVTFTAAPAGGITAQGVGNLVGGSLSSITMTQWGVGYTSTPAISVGGIGTGAAAVAVALFTNNPLSSEIGNPLAVHTISNNWNGNRYSLNFMAFFLFQAYARQLTTASQIGPPSVFTHVLQQNTLYGGSIGSPNIAQAAAGVGQLSLASFQQSGGTVYIQPPPDQLYITEWDMTFLSAPLVALSDLETQVVDPWKRAVQFRAAELLSIKHQNWGITNEFGAKYDSHVPRIITTSGGIRVPNPYNRNFQRRVGR